MGRDFAATMRSALENGRKGLLRSVVFNDTSIAATRQLIAGAETGAILRRKYQGLVEAQNEQEANAYYIELRLRQAGRTP